MARKTIKDMEKDLKRMIRGWKGVADDLPVIAGVEAVKMIELNFERQGFINNGSLDKWESRQPGAPRDDRPILTDTTNLRDSVRYVTQGMKVLVGVDSGKVPYAKIHNEGGTITVPVTDRMRSYFWAMYYKTGQNKWKGMALTRKTTFQITIPRRQYMGLTPDLVKRIFRELEIPVDKMLDRI